MYSVSRSLYRAGFLVALAAAALTVGCGKKTVAPPPTPPPPAPAPARPTVTLQASPSSVNAGESSTLSWNSTDATQLSIDPGVGAVPAQGTAKVTPSDTATYTITASGPGGSTSATATVTVNAPPPPPQKVEPEPDFNLGLGDRRANAVKQYLVSLGVSADRLSTVSFGKEKPFCRESNEACWQQNRRGHFVKAN